jgi:hypothetical protein
VKLLAVAVVEAARLVTEVQVRSTVLVVRAIGAVMGESLRMRGRVRQLEAQVNELEHRVEVVYAEHEVAVDEELERLLED